MGRYVIASEKAWNQTIIPELNKSFPQDSFVLISNRVDLCTLIKKINPDKIFFPHWSYIIPKDIYDHFECIVFHMTDLPFGRGGSPLQNLIVRGFEETMISALKVNEEIDAGDIYLKKTLRLHGSAEEIYIRANDIIISMIKEIIKLNLIPIPQKGKITFFKRRNPTDSDISNLGNINEIYDYIRMLDAETYPHAYININGIQYSFRRVSKKADGSLEADVIIKDLTHV